MLGYGSSATVATMLVRGRDALLPVLVGQFGGASGIGIVSLAMRLVETMSFARKATSQLAIVAVGWLQTDSVRLKRALEESMALQLLALGPILAGFAVLSPWIVTPVFGPRWHTLVYVFPFFAAAQLATAVFTMHLSALLAIGRVRFTITSSVLRLLIILALVWPLGWRYGIAGASASVTVSIVGFVLLDLGLRHFVAVSYRTVTPLLLMCSPFLAAPFVPKVVIPLLAAPMVACLAVPQPRRQTWALVRLVASALLPRIAAFRRVVRRRSGGDGHAGAPMSDDPGVPTVPG
jgi:PST family polysaccharide transporter